MIQIDKREIKACCGKTQVSWKLSVPLKKDYLPFLQKAGFTVVKTYLDAGMMYIEDKALIARGVFGLNEIIIKCKSKQCPESSNVLEQTLLSNL